MGFDITDPLAGISPENQSRLKTLGALALTALQTIVFSGGALTQIALLQFIGGASKLLTPADVKWLLETAVKAGKMSAAEAWLVLKWIEIHAPHAAPHIDPNDMTTWGLGAPPLPVKSDGTIELEQTPQDPQKP